jgi:hypothetical protein
MPDDAKEHEEDEFASIWQIVETLIPREQLETMPRFDERVFRAVDEAWEIYLARKRRGA